MRFLILGPLKVIDGDRVVALPGRKRVTTLAVLLANAGQVVPLEYLIDAVWDDTPPTTARRQVQNEISALRRALSGGDARKTAIISDGHGYRIVPAPGELDAQVFADLVAEALELANRDEPAAAVVKLRTALRLWRGPALLGVSGRALEATTVRLEEQRLAATEQCFDLELGLGRHRELVGELAELVATHPLREHLVGQLMLALHGSGRQPEALAVYDRLRTRLADELGLTPGTPLRQLHSAVLRGDPAITPRAEPPVAPSAGNPAGNAGTPPVPAQLPADVAGFTGRVDHLRRLDELLPEHGRQPKAVVISAIAGMGGVGKTALAVHWGHRVRDRFPDGQLYVDLRGFATDAPVRPAAALTHLLRSLGEPDERIPADVQTAAGRYRSLLADRRMLVVLDNAADADQVRPLLPAGPGCQVLVTSRDRLTGLLARDGAGSLPLDVLSQDESHALLAATLGPDRVAAEPAATAELARLCAHLPLALRVAAANLVSRPWPSIAEYAAALRTGDRMNALNIDGDEQAGVRQAFDLSYRTLDPGTQRFFRLLSLVPGPDVTVAAAAALADTGTEHARRQLDRLVTMHLADQPALGRYSCHDLLRDYAADRSRAEDTSADRDAALRRLNNWHLHCADRAIRVLYGTALRHLAAEAADDATAQTTTQLSLGDSHFRQGRPEPAVERYEAGLTLAEQTEWTQREIGLVCSLAVIYRDSGRLRHAAEYFERGLKQCRANGFRHSEAVTLDNLGRVYLHMGRLATAADCCAEALRINRAIGSRLGEATALGYLGEILHAQGRLDEAADHLDEALPHFAELGDRTNEACALRVLAAVRCDQGDTGEAAELGQAALALARELGERKIEAEVLNTLGVLAHRTGQYRDAVEHHERALHLARVTKHPYPEAEALIGLASANHSLAHWEQAAGHASRALEITRQLEYGLLEQRTLTVLDDLGLSAD